MRKDYFHFSLYTVRAEMCEFIFACMILDLAQSELARESFQTLGSVLYLPFINWFSSY